MIILIELILFLIPLFSWGIYNLIFLENILNGVVIVVFSIISIIILYVRAYKK
jgi:hypothetical protein